MTNQKELMMSKELINKLVAHEGVKRFAYKDTLGFLTIGCGRVIDSRVAGTGLSIDEIFYLLNNDITKFRKELSKHTWFNKQNAVRQEALIELAFNMGTPNLLKFKNMIASLMMLDYETAVIALVDSKWATQVGKNRVADIRHRLLHGAYR